MSKTKNKKAALVITGVFLAAAVIGALYLMLKDDEKPEFEASYVYDTEYKKTTYLFCEPDYEANIFDDPDYIKQIPYIYYTNGNVTVCITDENYKEYGAVVELFGKYFDALKNGDTETFNSLHSERYFKFNRCPEEIAPQRVYDIHIEFIAAAKTDDPLYGNVGKYIFKTSYSIMKNDGTFRTDIGSDMARPLYLEIVEKNGKLFIDACGNSFNYPEENN